jgi:hypothetical protein
MKNVGPRVGNLPTLGEARMDVQVLVSSQEIVENEVINALGIRVESYPWIEIGRVVFNDHH